MASHGFKNSPAVLYRILHYFDDRKRPFKIADFYKGHILRVHHPRGLCFADIEFWKHEIALRLTADSSLCASQKQEGPLVITCGVPGAMDGDVTADSEVMDWYRLLIQLLESPVMIYGGNNFEV